MGASYGISYECDGCGEYARVWPKMPPGIQPCQADYLPPGWKWVRCRDSTHRKVRHVPLGSSGWDAPGHLAHVLACPACAPDVTAWILARKHWEQQRQELGKTVYLRDILGSIFGSWAERKMIERWERDNPRPPACWPKAAASLAARESR